MATNRINKTLSFKYPNPLFFGSGDNTGKRCYIHGFNDHILEIIQLIPTEKQIDLENSAIYV